MAIKDWFIVAFCTTGDLISFYVGEQLYDYNIVKIGLSPARYVYIFMRQDGYIVGYELNFLGRWLLV